MAKEDKSISATGLAYTAPSALLVCGQVASCPLVPNNLTPTSALRALTFSPLDLAPPYFLTFDYLPLPLSLLMKAVS